MILLANEQYIKESTSLQDTIDSKLITAFIVQAQELYITEVLGSALYATILEKVALNTLNSYEVNLIALLKKVLAQRTVQLMLPTMAFQTTQAGVVTKSGENFQPAGKSLVDYVVSNYKDIAEHYTARTFDYLNANSAHFPNWGIDVTDPFSGYGGNTMKHINKNQTYDSGISFY